MGTIEHRGKNTWRIGERLPAAQGRKWIRRTFTYPDTMTEAEQRRAVEIEMARLTVDIDDGRAVPESPLTVRQLADIWLRDLESAKTMQKLVEQAAQPENACPHSRQAARIPIKMQ